MVNNVVLVGRLVKDPELNQAGEVPVCKFILTVDRNYKNGEGERDTGTGRMRHPEHLDYAEGFV